jgi:hypothetical protein
MINHHRVNKVPSRTPCCCEDDFRKHEIDLLVGTQMIAKGLDFLSSLAVPPKTSRNKQEQTKTKEKATFSLQARFTKNFFK